MWRVVAAMVALVLVVLVMASPPVTARLAAVAVTAEVLGVAVPRPFAADVTRTPTRVGGVLGDLYAAEDPAPAMVLLPGATPAGRDDTRTVSVAASIARSGRTVFVPELALYDRRVEPDDLDAIARAALALPRHRLGQGPVSIVGFSYGGSYGLVAAADPRLAGQLAQVATFGAYWDLLGVIQAATTGTSTVGGRRLAWDADPAAADLLAEHAVQLAPPDQRDELAAALEGHGDPDQLSPEAAALHDLLTNDDPARTQALAARLGVQARATLRRFSPSAVAGDIDAPLVALHALDDPAVPVAEALRLRRDRPDARLLRVELFDHVDFTGGGLAQAAPDLWRTWRFTAWVLAAQERW